MDAQESTLPTAAPPSVIQVEDLRKTYSGGWFGQSYEALRGVSFTVNRGEIFALLGPNGAGKTTLIKVLLGIVRKSQGAARLLDKPAGHRQSRRRVGYLPEQLRLPKHHNSLTALGLLGRLSGMSGAEVKQKQEPLLERVGLAKWAKTPLRKYSKGMLQRLGLAQALLHDPEVLILDEPTDGLDPVGRREVREVLEQLKSEGKTVFINSHLLQEIELFCDRVAIMALGSLRHLGSIDELSAKLDADGALVWMILHGSSDSIDAALQEVVGAIEPAKDASSAVGQQVHRESMEVGERLTISLPDQAAIDHCVDRLRAHGVSIAQLAKKRMTLEDAFLKLIAQES